MPSTRLWPFCRGGHWNLSRWNLNRQNECFAASSIVFHLCSSLGLWLTGQAYFSNGLAMNVPWWRYQMETVSEVLHICAGYSPVTGEIPVRRPVTRTFDVIFNLRLNKRLSKHWWGWRFETPSRPLWHHCNGGQLLSKIIIWKISVTFCVISTEDDRTQLFYWLSKTNN